MNTLLDTHTFIWFVNGEKKISEEARKVIETMPVTNYLSIASLWEIAIKISLGKLQLKNTFTDLFHQIEINNFKLLPVTFDDTLIVSDLPFHHRDPFDRLLVAQCLNNKLTLISKDLILKQYLIDHIW